MGFIDWLSLADCEQLMEVNFYGTVRTVNQFLPIFKSQSSSQKYVDGRIVNMSSVAGFFYGALATAFSVFCFVWWCSDQLVVALCPAGGGVLSGWWPCVGLSGKRSVGPDGQFVYLQSR